MTSQPWVRLLTFMCAVFLSSCGGGGGGGGTPAEVSTLAGTWFGTEQDNLGAMHQVTVTVNASGNITQVVTDGVDQSETGTISKSKAGPNIFAFVLSDSTEGGFIVDAGGTHMGFVDDSQFFGVLQKGATALPPYAAEDIAASWSGYGVTLNANFDVTQTFNSSATIANDPTRTFTGNDFGGAFSGSFPTSPTLGRWTGTFSQSTTGGPVSALLSADKTFVASQACGGTFPDGCSFSAWNRGVPAGGGAAGGGGQ